MPYIPSSTYESRGPSDLLPAASFIDARSRHPASHTSNATEITGFVTPTQGTAGSTVSLQLRTNYDLAAEQYTFIFMFGKKACVADLQKVDYDDDWYNYVLNVEVPPFPLTNDWNPTMMLKLQMDKDGHLRHQSDAGKFTYTDMSPNLAYQSASDFPKKRKFSLDFADEEDFDSIAAKRQNTQRFQEKSRSMSAVHSSAQLSPLPAQSSLSGGFGQTGAYDMSRSNTYSSQLSHKGLYAVPSIGQGDLKPPQMSPGLQAYSHYSSLGQPSRSPGTMAATPAGLSVLPSPSSLPAPTLVRATIAQSGTASSGPSFNPYAMYQTKAVLKIEGNLDTMSENWSQEEVDAKRRLVQFERSQQGSTISTTFAPVTPEARPARSICVSCIWWEEKDEYYITSVDTIFLLEQLVNVRFTVEEKNRIRRNLEGFRPLTVSKAKADSEEFFKVIMGFPTPKPRNIEKDVKVFAWKILSHALKKIISKYVSRAKKVYQLQLISRTVCKLCLNSRRRIPPSYFSSALWCKWACICVRQYASKYLSAIGLRVDGFSCLYSQHDVDELIAQLQDVSGLRGIIRTWHADPTEDTLSPKHDSVGSWFSSAVALPVDPDTSWTSILGVWLSQQPRGSWRTICITGTAI